MGVGLAVFLVAVGLCLVSMALFALEGGRRDPDAVGKSAQFLGGFGDFILHWFMWAIDPATRLSVRLGLTPDFFNWAGLALGLASGIAIGVGALELGGWAIALTGVCDILDGRIARLTKVANTYGDFIDSILDRWVEILAFLGFVVYLRHTAYGSFLAIAAMAASILVSYTRGEGELAGVNCTGGLMQRAERLALTSLVCLLDPAGTRYVGQAPGTWAVWVLGFIAVTSAATAVQRTLWIAGQLRTRR